MLQWSDVTMTSLLDNLYGIILIYYIIVTQQYTGIITPYFVTQPNWGSITSLLKHPCNKYSIWRHLIVWMTSRLIEWVRCNGTDLRVLNKGWSWPRGSTSVLIPWGPVFSSLSVWTFAWSNTVMIAKSNLSLNNFPLSIITWIPWNLSFRYILFHEKRLQTMLWHHNARVNSHQRWKQTRNRVCFHLWCVLTLALWCHSIVWSIFSWNKM